MPFASSAVKIPLLATPLLSLVPAGCASSLQIPSAGRLKGDEPPDSLNTKLKIPSGSGPFPAVVLMHGCGGWHGGNITDWANWFAERDWCVGNPEPPMPAAAIVLGDFNMEPGSEEYQMLCAATDDTGITLLTDVWALHNPGREVMSWHSNPSKRGPKECALLDYCLVSEELRTRVSSCWIDEVAAGSDHQPLWVEFDTN